MTVSEKQLIANRQNALKSTGPRTDCGKAFASRNALKHGLLAKEVVIDEGEGAEDRQAFDALMADLIDQFSPVGPLEEILVEKIAVCYWRMQRAHRCEVGFLREKLDTLSDDYYAGQGRLTDARIDAEIADKQTRIKTCLDRCRMFSQARLISQDLSSTYCWKEDWLSLQTEFLAPRKKIYTVDGQVAAVVHFDAMETNPADVPPQDIRRKLNEKGHSDEQIWQMLIDLCRRQTDQAQAQIEQLQKDKINHRLRLQRIQKCSALPPKSEMDNLLRYETAIERQLYNAVHQLERLQRHRSGEFVPPPVQVDLNLNDQNLSDLKTGS